MAFQDMLKECNINSSKKTCAMRRLSLREGKKKPPSSKTNSLVSRVNPLVRVTMTVFPSSLISELSLSG